MSYQPVGQSAPGASARYQCTPEFHRPESCWSLQGIWRRTRKCIDTCFIEFPNTTAISGIALAVLGKVTSSLNASGASLPLKVTSIGCYSVATLLAVGLLYNWRHIPKYFLAQPASHAVRGRGIQVGMGKKRYQERVCTDADGTVLGRVFYENTKGKFLPVIETNTKDNRERGYLKGLLLAPQIHAVYFKAMRLMERGIGVQDGDILCRKLRARAKTLHFPKEHLEEIQGMIEGVQEYGRRNGKTMRLSVEDFLMVHVMPDAYKKVFFSLGCSVLVIKREDEICTIRNMDWVPLDVLGEYSILFREVGVDEVTGAEWKTETLGFPGYFGALTTKNHDLTLILNECGGVSKEKGTPHSLFTSKLIRRAHSVEDVEQLLADWEATGDLDFLPASSFILTAVDSRGEAKAFQFYVEEGKFFTPVTFNDKGYFALTNNALTEEGVIIPDTASASSSEGRLALIKARVEEGLRRGESIRKIARDALRQKGVNVPSTIATALFYQRLPFDEESQEDFAEYVFDNTEAASHLEEEASLDTERQEGEDAALFGVVEGGDVV